VHRSAATSKRISSHLRRHSPLSFTTNCVSAARPTRRRRAQSDLVSISRFFENGTQQLPNILEQYILRSLRWSGLTRMPYETRICRFLSSQQARQSNRDQHSASNSSGGDGDWRRMRRRSLSRWAAPLVGVRWLWGSGADGEQQWVARRHDEYVNALDWFHMCICNYSLTDRTRRQGWLVCSTTVPRMLHRRYVSEALDARRRSGNG